MIDSTGYEVSRRWLLDRLDQHAQPGGKPLECCGCGLLPNLPGKGVAGELFNPEELGHLRRFAAALHNTVRPEAAGKEMSGTAAKALAKAVDLVAGMIAFKVGGLPAAAGTYGAKVGQRALVGGVGAARARRSFEGSAPRLSLPPPGYATAAGASTGRVLAPLGGGIADGF